MLAYFTLLFLGSTFAQVILPGKCPAVSVKSDFDVQQYIGRWFEQRRYFAIFQFGLQCVTATYSANNNGTVNIVNQGTYPLMRDFVSLTIANSRIGVKPSITGLAYAKTAEKAKLSVIFPSLPVHVEGSYWILDTDYISYAVVWSCTNISFISVRFAWILTRERHIPDDILEKAYKVLDKYKINKWLFLKTDQTNCPTN